MTVRSPHDQKLVTTQRESSMETFPDRVQVLQSESERIKQYLHALPLEALSKPSACTQWQVQDVIAHLIGVAETYANAVSRGLQGDTGPLPGRLPAGQATAALSAESIAQRSIAARKTASSRFELRTVTSFLSRSTSTDSTPATCSSSALTARSQWPQCIPGTL